MDTKINAALLASLLLLDCDSYLAIAQCSLESENLVILKLVACTEDNIALFHLAPLIKKLKVFS